MRKRHFLILEQMLHGVSNNDCKGERISDSVSCLDIGEILYITELLINVVCLFLTVQMLWRVKDHIPLYLRHKAAKKRKGSKRRSCIFLYHKNLSH